MQKEQISSLMFPFVYVTHHYIEIVSLLTVVSF